VVGLHGVEQADDISAFAHVGLYRDGLATCGLDRGDDGIGARLARGIIDDDGRAFSAECLGDACTDAA
jgi:hypothetical protein